MKRKEKSIGRGSKIALIIIGVLIVAFLIYLFSFKSSVFPSQSNTNAGTNLNSVQNCRDVQVPYDYVEEYQESVPYTDTECETKNLAYSIVNTAFDYDTCNRYEDLCLKYFLGICSEKKTFCVDRSVSCSLDIRNLDPEQGGTWTIRHTFYEQGTNAIIDTVDNSLYLYPQTTQRVSGQVRITSSGEDGDANRNMGSCNYRVTNNPTKQVCRDVIKYKEVTKTRTVTRYRTEQKCN